MAIQDEYIRITLRIPKDLHSLLAESAEDTSKSMNAEIVARLKDSFSGSHQAEQIADLVAQKLKNELARMNEGKL